jgi:type IV secretory pathway TrbD component
VVAVLAVAVAVVCLVAQAWVAGAVVALFAVDVLMVRHLRYAPCTGPEDNA